VAIPWEADEIAQLVPSKAKESPLLLVMTKGIDFPKFWGKNKFKKDL